jgi:hypothetical protein
LNCFGVLPNVKAEIFANFEEAAFQVEGNFGRPEEHPHQGVLFFPFSQQELSL